MHALEYFAILRKRWLYIIIPLLAGLATSAVLSLASNPEYQATASVYFSLPYGNTASDLFQGSNYTQQQLASYANLTTMPVVLQPVIDKLGLGVTTAALAGKVTAVSSADTVIIDIRAADQSPAEAANIANAVADQLGVVVKQLSPKDATGKSQIDVSTVGTASAPSAPSSPKTKRNLAVGGLAGLFLGLLIALARDRFDTRVRTIKDIPGVSGLATISFDKAARRSPLIGKGNARSIRAEAFRQLRTNLQFVDVGKPVKVMVVTSSIAAEGKSSTAANLAVMFAETGRKVLLVEADLRRPRVSDYLDLERSVGLTNVLAGHVDVDSVLQTWGPGGLSVLPSGSIPPNPSELLGSQNMINLLTILRARFDMIVMDTPPLLPVTDAAVTAVQTDGAVIVVRYGKTTRNQVNTALQSLRSVDARVLGVVLNMVPTKGTDSAVSYDGYGYYEDDPASGPPLENKTVRSGPGRARQDAALNGRDSATEAMNGATLEPTVDFGVHTPQSRARSDGMSGADAPGELPAAVGDDQVGDDLRTEDRAVEPEALSAVIGDDDQRTRGGWVPGQAPTAHTSDNQRTVRGGASEPEVSDASATTAARPRMGWNRQGRKR